MNKALLMIAAQIPREYLGDFIEKTLQTLETRRFFSERLKRPENSLRIEKFDCILKKRSRRLEGNPAECR